MLSAEKGKLRYYYDSETVILEAWGDNSLRIRAFKESRMPEGDWALLNVPPSTASIRESENGMEITNGKIRANVSQFGKITVFNSDGKLLLEEYCRNRKDVCDPKCGALEVEAREFKPNIGGLYHLTCRFESLDPDE